MLATKSDLDFLDLSYNLYYYPMKIIHILKNKIGHENFFDLS
jgi:hypothetical protein